MLITFYKNNYMCGMSGIFDRLGNVPEISKIKKINEYMLQ